MRSDKAAEVEAKAKQREMRTLATEKQAVAGETL